MPSIRGISVLLLAGMAQMIVLSACAPAPAATDREARAEQPNAPAKVSIREALNDYHIAHADWAAGLVTMQKLERAERRVFRVALAQPRALLPFIELIHRSRRARFALQVLERIEGVRYLRQTDVRPKKLVDMRRWREHFKAKRRAFKAADRPRATLLKQARRTVDRFYDQLFAGKAELAYTFVHWQTRENGAKQSPIDPIATIKAVDYDFFKRELDGTPRDKFRGKEITATWLRTPQEAVVKTISRSKSIVDRDTLILKRHEGEWFITNPIHVIR